MLVKAVVEDAPFPAAPRSLREIEIGLILEVDKDTTRLQRRGEFGLPISSCDHIRVQEADLEGAIIITPMRRYPRLQVIEELPFVAVGVRVVAGSIAEEKEAAHVRVTGYAGSLR
jgi:hypothetical protein